MHTISKLLLWSATLFVFGCANNGKHLYVGDNCLSCWNNPLTLETLDYETAGANNYATLNWLDLMLEGLTQNNSNNLSLYGEDYLYHKIGIKTVSLKQNEIRYQKEIHRASQELKVLLEQHRIKPAYQITVPSRLGKYDFNKSEFPLNLARSFQFSGGSGVKILPRKIVVNVSNFESLPNLQMSSSEAERFLKNRNNSRGLYVRYIVEILGVDSPSSFNVRVKEIQYIDVAPSIITKRDREKYAPFKVVKINA
ncbi:MAG: hypothetical protein CSA49_03740 [Gammaproteobacteria bacterium]|nr:MAG: hypothetical protein CSA49_03740 [Gammaproteobacteria bacterium]